MKFNISMEKEAYEQINSIMKYNDEINGGDEIGGWLTGDWNFTTDDKGVTTGALALDKFVLPKQKVSRVEVDISPESMMDTIKTIGVEQSNRIKAHWHIHPFNKGDTDWSSIDEEKIANFISPVKNRQIFVFLLSSLDQIKARVEICYYTKTKFMEQPQVYYETYNNIPVNVIGLNDELPPVAQEMKALIEANVTRPEPVVTTNDDYWEKWKNGGYYGNNQVINKKWEVKIMKKDRVVLLRLTAGFGDFVYNYQGCPKEVVECDYQEVIKEKAMEERWYYKVANKKEAKVLKQFLEDEITYLEKAYNNDYEEM